MELGADFLDSIGATGPLSDLTIDPALLDPALFAGSTVQSYDPGEGLDDFVAMQASQQLPQLYSIDEATEAASELSFNLEDPVKISGKPSKTPQSTPPSDYDLQTV